MLHKESVTPELLELTKKLMADQYLKDFILVGGTALALQIGHRKSIDIDLFTQETFDKAQMADHLKNNYPSVETDVTNPVDHYIGGIKVSAMTHAYPSEQPIIQTEGIRMASEKEIAAMKINAVIGNGRRLKDFADLYFILERHSLKDLLEAYHDKYPGMHEDIVRESLQYFDEIVPIEINYTNRSIGLERIKGRLRDACKNPIKKYTKIGLLPKKRLQQNKGRNRRL